MHMGPWTGSSTGRGVWGCVRPPLGHFQRGLHRGPCGRNGGGHQVAVWVGSFPPTFLLHGWMETIPLEWSVPLWPLTGRVPSLPDRLQNDRHLLTRLPQSCLSSRVCSSRRRWMVRSVLIYHRGLCEELSCLFLLVPLESLWPTLTLL